MKVTTLQCDGCKQLKLTDSNHWWAGYRLQSLNGGLYSGAMLLPVDQAMLRVTRDLVQLPEPDAHLCGIECAQKWLLRNLKGGD